MADPDPTRPNRLPNTAVELFNTFNWGKSADNISPDHPQPTPDAVALLKANKDVEGVRDVFEQNFGEGSAAAILGISRARTPR
jgi:hypothetical protein